MKIFKAGGAALALVGANVAPVLALMSLIVAPALAQAPPEEPAVRLESTFIGDKEQPAVSYFVPWQGTSTPDKLQWNIQDKHDATLQTIDREVMLRSINIYDEMNLENN